MTRAIMIQGTGSNVGKSLLVTGLVRAFSRRGLRVVPFKAQNISNNAAVTEDGGEIGRAQALQARAAGRDPHSDMNPVLLKPEGATGVQVILQGQRLDQSEAARALRDRHQLMRPVLESFHRLARAADLIVVEGAGSPAETNLRKGDIANMGFARAMDIPVLLVGDIERGGVIAQIVGTKAVLEHQDGCQIKGFIINKFRGITHLFDEGRDDILNRTGWPCCGVVPWFEAAWTLPAEDMLDLASRSGGACKIAVPQLPHMANFDDLDPLGAEPNVTLDIIAPGQALPGDADLVVLPGSKSTLSDLAFFRAEGWDIDLQAHLRRGGHVIGLCGGYQMLGTHIADPLGVDGPPGGAPGLGHLDIQTEMRPAKTLANVRATTLPDGYDIEGYEIHMGHTVGADCDRAWLQIGARKEGAASANGRVMGCYLHGIFASDPFRKAVLHKLGHKSDLAYEDGLDSTLDALALHLETHMDLDMVLSLARDVEI